MSDYISREDLIERLKKAKNSIPEVNPMMMNGCLCGLERAIMETISISSVDVVEQKHGSWWKTEDELGEAWMCSGCLEEFFSEDPDFPKGINFCPNCGARMVT